MEDNLETTEINKNNNNKNNNYNNNNDNIDNTKNNMSYNKNENGEKEKITLNKLSVNTNNVNKNNDDNKKKYFENTSLKIEFDLEEEKEENEDGDDDEWIQKQEKGGMGGGEGDEAETGEISQEKTIEKESSKAKDKNTAQKKTKYPKNENKPRINVKKKARRKVKHVKEVYFKTSSSSSSLSESMEDLENESGEDSLSKSLKLLELSIRQCRKDLGKLKERRKKDVERKTDKEEESCTQKNLSTQPPTLLSSQSLFSNFQQFQPIPSRAPLTPPNIQPTTAFQQNCYPPTLNTLQNIYPVMFQSNPSSSYNNQITTTNQTQTIYNRPPTTTINKPPTTTPQQPATINQPPTLTNQPATTTTNPPPTIINQISAPINQPSITTKRPPTTTNQPPTTTTNQPPTTDSLFTGSFLKCQSQKSMFGPLCSQFNTPPASALKNEKVTVFIRVVFLKIGEIDTMKENFVADAFIQARWHEPLLDGKSDIDRNTIDWRTFWNPKVYIENCFNEPKETIWQTLSFNSRGVATVFEKRRIRACFIENLELDDFPFDTQDLTLTVTTERSDHEVELEEDTDEISSINVQSFVDEQEWKLHSHVETWKKITTKTYQISKAKHPAFATSCRATRRPGFFIWNIFLVMLFICSLTFSTFCVDLIKLENRLQLSFILLLTTVTFKFVVSQTLPRISYLTLLDKYILISMAILCTVCVWHVVVFSAFKDDLKRARILDWWALIVSASGYALFHLIFFFSIYLGVGLNFRMWFCEKGRKCKKRRSYDRKIYCAGEEFYD